MAAVGGSITELTLNGRIFTCTADSDSPRKKGGTENEVLANGNRTARLIKTVVPWGKDSVTIECDDSRDDHDYLQTLADLPDFFAISATYASGITFAGTGQIIGELAYNNMTASATFGVSGQGTFDQQ